MAIYTVTLSAVGSQPIEVYGGLAAADAYIDGMIGAGAEAYRALVADSDDRKRLLIAATRWIDSLSWQGDAAGLSGADATTLAFPRDAVSNGDDAATQLAKVERAVFELVALAAEDSEVLTVLDSSSNLKTVKAGSAGVEYFAPTSTRKGSATQLPTTVQRLIGAYLATATASYPGAPSGESGACSSNFDSADAYTRTEPY